MKVRELLAALSEADPDAEVIMQKDAEGNGYSPLAVVDLEAVYVPDTTWSGEVLSLSWTAYDADMEQSEWDEMRARPRCVVLAPVN